MKVVLIDYGVGNLRSVRKALEQVGAQVLQTSDPEVILSGDKVVLPGVGAFKDGMAGLAERGLIQTVGEVVKRGTPLLGICLGMQLFFERSSEMGDTPGLGYIGGEVRMFSSRDLKVPQTGWNQLQIKSSSPLVNGIDEGTYVYFNHSFYCAPSDPRTAVIKTDYGVSFASAIQFGSIYGVQFHPEKSQDAGLRILKNFVEVCQ
jgi:glutamine amidotransferase